MYKNIMVPTDGSGFDREAILVALRVAERCEGKIRLVRVLTSGAYFGMASSEGIVASEEAIRIATDAALAELHALAVECRNMSSATVTADVEQGPIADALAGYARRNQVDLIVISSHGRRGIARLALGSVTDLLIRQTTIPVLVVKPKASYLTPEARKEFHSIVVPLDGSGLAEQVLSRVVALAKLEEAEVTLLHVLAPEETSQTRETSTAPWWKKKVAGARAYLSRRAMELRRQGVSAKVEVVIGDKIAEAITDYARRERADLIAIATHGRGGFARVVRGSVADGVTKCAMSSILVFHPDREAEKGVSAESVGKPRERTATPV